MKIGILTYHFAINYGAVLQCYALQQTLHELGYADVEIINYNTYNWRLLFQNIPHKLSLETLHKAFLKFSHWTDADKPFSEFVTKYLNCTRPVSEKELPDIAKRFDAIIVGSDQIWSPRMRRITPYFLNWKPSYMGKRIAYAPCCMIRDVDPAQVETLSTALKMFDFLSVRDKETQDFVSNLIGIKPDFVPDPTILQDFSSLVSDEPLIKDPYIFTYILGDDIPGGNKHAIDRIKGLFPNMKVYCSALPKTNPVDTSWADFTIYDLNPVDWLNMIKYASFVFTDSFHATLFSLKFHTPFFTYYSMPTRKSRFDDLIERLAIGDFVLNNESQITNICQIDTIRIDNLLSQLRLEGVNYLNNALSNNSR